MTLEFATRLQSLRKKNGFSQEELADKIGVSRQAVSKWERGEASPDTDNLIELSKLYGVTLDELVTGDEAKTEQATAFESETAAEEEEPAQENKEEEFHFVSEDGDEMFRDKDGFRATTKDGDKVHIGFDGIYVDSEDGDHVRIDRKGIHVESSDGEHVHIGRNGVQISDVDEEKELKRKKTRIVLDVIGTLTVIGSLIAYILLGTFCHLWHPAWIVFFAIPVIPSLCDAIVKRNPNHFAYPVFITAVYLLCCCVYGLWHPMWVLFLTIPVYYGVIKIFRKK